VRGPVGPWPDAAQLLLMRASVGEGDVARNAWAQWHAGGNSIERLDETSYALLPQLYRNLARLGVNDPTLGKLRGVYRHTWYRNNLLFHAAAPVLHALGERAIPVMVLKGGALATLYPSGLGARPMADLDLLVHDGDVGRAVRVLEQAGLEDVSLSGLDATRRTRHAAPFCRSGSIEIDLHWRPYYQAGDADGVWARAVQSKLAGAPVLVPSPTDLLLHACVHGVAISLAPKPWIPDAVLVIRGARDRIDWAALLETACAYEVTLVLRHALTFLRDELSVDVPEETLTALARVPTSATERLVYLVAARRIALPHGAGYVGLWDQYSRLARSRGERPHLGGFLHYFAEVYGLPRRRALAPFLARKAVRIIHFRLSWAAGRGMPASRASDSQSAVPG
jgi:putative nucleotidyltransferase-like protein